MESLREQNERDTPGDLRSQRDGDTSRLDVLALFDSEVDTTKLLANPQPAIFQDDEDREPHIIRGYN